MVDEWYWLSLQITVPGTLQALSEQNCFLPDDDPVVPYVHGLVNDTVTFRENIIMDE